MKNKSDNLNLASNNPPSSSNHPIEKPKGIFNRVFNYVKNIATNFKEVIFGKKENPQTSTKQDVAPTIEPLQQEVSASLDKPLAKEETQNPITGSRINKAKIIYPTIYSST